MKTIEKQLCPLCEKHQAEIEHKGFDFKFFKCPNCTEFIIVTNAEECLKTAFPDHLASISDLAKTAAQGYIVIIEKHPPGPNAGFSAERVLRSSLAKYNL